MRGVRLARRWASSIAWPSKNKDWVIAAFPGQGSQKVGMGQDLDFPEAKQVFQAVDETLGMKLCSEIMATGPEEALNKTENAQPALLAYSLAMAAGMKLRFGLDHTSVTLAMGHSLGEFSAMAFTAAMSVEDAARTVSARGKAMQCASDRAFSNTSHTFSMVALMPISFEDASAACSLAREEMRELHKELNVCQVANQNGPSQVVISGTKAVVDRAVEIAKKDFRVRRAVPLKVSAPFHSTIMKDAEGALKLALDQVSWSNPSIPIVSNVTAQPVNRSDVLRELALQQLVAPVRWTESVHGVLEQAKISGAASVTFIEVGGSVLTPLFKTIVKDTDAAIPVNYRSLASASDLNI